MYLQSIIKLEAVINYELNRLTTVYNLNPQILRVLIGGQPAKRILPKTETKF